MAGSYGTEQKYPGLRDLRGRGRWGCRTDRVLLRCPPTRAGIIPCSDTPAGTMGLPAESEEQSDGR